MVRKNIKEWLQLDPSNDREANFYRLLAVLKSIDEVAKVNVPLALRYIDEMIVELELAHLKYFDDYDYLHHLKVGKHVVIMYYMKLAENKKYDLTDIAKTEYWKQIKIESPTAV